jgi:hypothetical protein
MQPASPTRTGGLKRIADIAEVRKQSRVACDDGTA